MITPPVERVVEPNENGGGGQTWYQPVSEDSILCRFGLHRPGVLRAKGWIGYFNQVRRFRCPCGQWEWLEYNGRTESRERVDPELDVEAAASAVRMVVARAMAKTQLDAHIPTCWGVPGQCISCGCSDEFGPCVSHRRLYE